MVWYVCVCMCKYRRTNLLKMRSYVVKLLVQLLMQLLLMRLMADDG